MYSYVYWATLASAVASVIPYVSSWLVAIPYAIYLLLLWTPYSIGTYLYGMWYLYVSECVVVCRPQCTEWDVADGPIQLKQ